MKPPIADPVVAPVLDDEEQTFYLNFPMLLWCYCSMFIIEGPFLGWILFPVFHRSHGKNPPHVAETMLGVVIAVCFFSALVAAVTSLLQPVGVSARDLKSTNWLGLPREVEWSQIEGAHFFWLFLPYALLSTPQKRNLIWLPLILKHKREFASSIEKYTTPDNPLRLFLRKRGY